jgi:hypothetical protein
VSKSPAWKAVKEQRGKENSSTRRRSQKIGFEIAAEQKAEEDYDPEELDRLIDEQDRDQKAENRGRAF